jgi:hypothetical protein
MWQLVLKKTPSDSPVSLSHPVLAFRHFRRPRIEPGFTSLLTDSGAKTVIQVVVTSFLNVSGDDAIEFLDVRYEYLTKVKMTLFFWVVTSCVLVGMKQRFGET